MPHLDRDEVKGVGFVRWNYLVVANVAISETALLEVNSIYYV